jgi:hypothetical protein
VHFLGLGVVNEVCFFDGSINYNYVQPVVMDSSISYYGPVIVYEMEFSKTDCGSHL